jgi:Neuraminidase (sialidase)
MPRRSAAQLKAIFAKLKGKGSYSRSTSGDSQGSLPFGVKKPTIPERGEKTDYGKMSLAELGTHIRRDWSKQGKGVNYAAKPYLEALQSGEIDATGKYFLDSGSSIVAYFLSNASTWRGPVAKAIKAELKKRLKTMR